MMSNVKVTSTMNNFKPAPIPSVHMDMPTPRGCTATNNIHNPWKTFLSQCQTIMQKKFGESLDKQPRDYGVGSKAKDKEIIKSKKK